MVFGKIFSGFFVKIVTGFDDTMIHIPIAGTLTKTKLGKIAFSIGILCAITLAIIISYIFASILSLLPYFKYVSAGLIFILSIVVYFDLISGKSKEKVKQKAKKDIKKIKKISFKKFIKLIFLGFLTALATIIDDSIAYSSLFLEKSFYPIIGIYIASIMQIIAIIYFSGFVSKIPYKKEITSFGLISLGFLVLFEII